MITENTLAKLTSRKWLREAIGGRVRNFVNAIGFSPTIIRREVAGEKYEFYIGNPTGKSWYGGAIDTSPEMAFVKEHLVARGGVVIECGAHHGAQTILLSRWVGDSGKVIAVEPIPENVAILKKNIELNGLTNVIVVPMAADNKCARVLMRPESNGSVACNRRSDTIEVQSVSLDRVAADLGVVPTFIKIDVEGYEYQVLEGAKHILSTMPAVFVEIHTLSLPRYGKQFDDLWSLLDRSRYEISMQAEDSDWPTRHVDLTSPGSRVHLFFKPSPQCRRPRRTSAGDD